MARRIPNRLLNKTGVVTRATYNDDGQGGDVLSLIVHPVNPSIKLRYYVPSGSDAEIADRSDEDLTYVMYCDPDINLEVDDRVIVDSIRLDVKVRLSTSDGGHQKFVMKEKHGIYNVITTNDGFTLQGKDDLGNLFNIEFKP